MDETMIEQLTQEYMRKLQHSIKQLIALGYERDDIQQEIRITLWVESQRYTPNRGNISLQKWLTYKVNYKLRTLKRNALRKQHR